MRLLNAATRFLGVYLQFFSDANPDKPLVLADIPEYKAGSIIAGHKQTGRPAGRDVHRHAWARRSR